MSSSEATIVVPARGRASIEPGASLAGLIGVLDRADGARRPVHTSAFRATVRAVPLRSVQLAPAARPARVPLAPPRTPTVTVVPDPERRPLTGLRDVVRRAALWGGGAHGEYLSWPTPEPTPRRPLRPRLHALTRRIALWGAGPHGEHLAWGRPAPTPVPQLVDPPVVLRELPGTPTNRPAASSPAVALIPAPTASGPRTGPTVLRAARPAPTGPVRPGWTPPPPGWPQPPAAWSTAPPVRVGRTVVVAPLPSRPRRTVPAARSPTSEARAGPARARGDPSSRSALRRPLPLPG